ncbi:MAG: NAD(P)/FAD-dependent oxidoreductase [Prevotellaceae bacterium]|jgi:predicted Rossmann fold flavoprotein|nr:NAD(P)/FAD-dependent oxidoreductase [Prevotellaceae bacterium]
MNSVHFTTFAPLMKPFDLIIVGAGAAGVVAAGRAASLGAEVLLLEKMEKPLRKLRISGKGRGNITNTKPLEEFLQKVYPKADFLRPAFAQLFNKELIALVNKAGVPTTVERGERVFPTSQKAWDVAEGLQKWARKNDAETLCSAKVTAVNRTEDRLFEVEFEHNGSEYAEKSRAVLIATGGASYPATGSTGDGYALAKKLGHTIVPIRPSLVPIEVEGFDRYRFSDLTMRNVRLSVHANGEKIDEEFGELMLTDFGVSGAITLRMSRNIVDALREKKKVELLLDWKPALSEIQLRNRLERELQNTEVQTAGELLRKLMPSPLISFFAEKAGVQVRAKVAESDKEKIVKTLKCCRLVACGYRPFTEAIVTAGGVSLSEVDENTLQSKLVPNLYFAGELLDLDADTGGYNLQIAFSTGWLAGGQVAR